MKLSLHQHSDCMAFVIQSVLATSNLSRSPDDWISSFPLTNKADMESEPLLAKCSELW